MAEEGGQGWLWKEGPAQAERGSVPGSRPYGPLTLCQAVQMARRLECGIQHVEVLGPETGRLGLGQESLFEQTQLSRVPVSLIRWEPNPGD